MDKVLSNLIRFDLPKRMIQRSRVIENEIGNKLTMEKINGIKF